MSKSNLTPPGKAEAASKSGAEASGEKKPRAPRKDYGYAKGATIVLTEGDKSYRGNRLRWYGHLQAANGKTVEQFDEIAELELILVALSCFGGQLFVEPDIIDKIGDKEDCTEQDDRS